MTREEVAEIMNYCKEYKVTYKSRLEELNIPVWRVFSGSFVPVLSFAGTTGRKQKSTPATPSGLKEMEIRTPAGSVIRICGELNENELFSIIWACNHVQP